MTASGATLRAWARTFPWPEPGGSGPLSGQLFVATPLVDLTPSQEPTEEDASVVATALRLARPQAAPARAEDTDPDD